MPKRTLTVEHALYLAAALLAVALRLIALGAFPLSEFEARWAMQAFDLQRGLPVQIGAQPLYVIFTSLIFSLAGSSEFSARVLPFIAGLVLVGLPYFYRDRLGTKTALLLTFALAIDPTLVGLSRLAGSSIAALAFGMAALTAWLRLAPRAAGVFAALAALSGPSFLAGVLSLALAWALANFLIPHRKFPLPSPEQFSLKTFALAFAACLLVAGTVFLRFPQGLSALGFMLPAYFSDWWTPGGVPLIQLWYSLLAYQPLALLFAILAAWRAWGDSDDFLGRGLCLWLLSALLLALSNPGRHPAELIWALIPMWSLAVRYIADHLRWSRQDGFPAWGQAALTALLLVFLMMNAIRLSSNPAFSAVLTAFSLFGRTFVISQQTVSLTSIIALGVVSTILIGAGWSPSAAVRGLVWGTVSILFVYTLSAAWNPLKLPHQTGRELWSPPPAAGNTPYLANFIGDFAEYSTGVRTGIDMVSTYDADLLRWELRLFPKAEFSTSLVEDSSPAVLLTGLNADQPRLSAFYRGQSISLLPIPLWDQLTASGWQRWLFFREVPIQYETVILWVRSDVFPEDYSLLQNLGGSIEWITP
jgi:hypothetical protein